MKNKKFLVVVVLSILFLAIPINGVYLTRGMNLQGGECVSIALPFTVVDFAILLISIFILTEDIEIK